MKDKTKDKLVKLLQQENILKYGKFTLRSGEVSDYYCDIKEAFGQPKILKLMVSEIAKIIPENTTCIAGSGYGGLPLSATVANKLNLPLTLVRDKIKDHGTKKYIDGYTPTKKDIVCIIDDVYTTGGSINDTKENLKSCGCKFTKPVVVLNRGNKNIVLNIVSGKDLK